MARNIARFLHQSRWERRILGFGICAISREE